MEHLKRLEGEVLNQLESKSGADSHFVPPNQWQPKHKDLAACKPSPANKPATMAISPKPNLPPGYAHTSLHASVPPLTPSMHHPLKAELPR